jgi:hypothetical protein
LTGARQSACPDPGSGRLARGRHTCQLTVNTQLQIWLDALPVEPGVLACAIRFPSQGWIGRVFDSTLDRQALDQATRCVMDTFRVMKLHRWPSQYLQWSYERGRVHAVRRADDWVLVVIASAEAAVTEALLRSWVEAFMGLSDT